jgi:peroxiredoxin
MTQTINTKPVKVQTGQQAPSFSLINIDKKMVALEDFRGRNVVLFFFPMAWTGVCTREMCLLEDDFNYYRDLDAEIIGISVDTLFALKHFKADYKLDNITLLSDFDKKAIHEYDIVIENFSFGYHGVAKRATFVIDANGIVRHAEVLEDASNFPDIGAVKACLESLRK